MWPKVTYKLRWADADDKVFEANLSGEAAAHNKAKDTSKEFRVANLAELEDGKLATVFVYEDGKKTEQKDYRGVDGAIKPATKVSDAPATKSGKTPIAPKAEKKAKGGKVTPAATPTPEESENPAPPQAQAPAEAIEKDEDTMAKSKAAAKAVSTKAVPKGKAKVPVAAKGKAKAAAPKKATPKTVGLPEKGQSKIAKKQGAVKGKMKKAELITYEEFKARHDTLRASFILLLAESLNKPIASKDIQEALYGEVSAANRNALSAVMRGTRGMIRNLSLPYDLQVVSVGSETHLKLATV